MSKRMSIYCIGCGRQTLAVPVNGAKIYPHRPDLSEKKFFQCPVCGNYVGTHRDGRPLGTIPTPELRRWRNKVHSVIDEYWLPTRNLFRRKELYAALSAYLGREYHTGTLGTVEDCMRVIDFYEQNFKKQYDNGENN